MNAPERIWIDWTEANANDFAYPEPPRHDFDGCEDEYVRADLFSSALARAERAEAELAKARELIAMLEGEQERADNLSDKLELERALTDGAHRRAKVAEALLAEAVEALRGYEAWEASIVLDADWSDATPKLTQAQCDRMIELQSQRNATLARIQEATK